MTRLTYIVGDTRRSIAAIPDGTVSTVVTSPPYWGRRRYTDDPDEIGTGPLGLYVAELVAIFEALRPKLRTGALVWLNVGDTASGSGGAGGDYNSGGKKDGARKYKQDASGLPTGTWCDVPGRVLHALIDTG